MRRHIYRLGRGIELYGRSGEIVIVMNQAINRLNKR